MEREKSRKIKAKYGIQSLPLIKIIDDETEEELEYWSGFKPDQIKYWQTVNGEDK